MLTDRMSGVTEKYNFSVYPSWQWIIREERPAFDIFRKPGLVVSQLATTRSDDIARK